MYAGTAHSLLVADGLDSAAGGRLEPVCQFLELGCCDSGQQSLGQLSFILAAHHKVLALEMAHVLIPQVLHIKTWHLIMIPLDDDDDDGDGD